MKPSPRLFVESRLGPDEPVQLDAGQAHYLSNVLRLPLGSEVLLFNGLDGEWRAQLQAVSKKSAEAMCVSQSRPQDQVRALDLYFAPVKGDRTDYIIEKATELGVGAIVPVISERTIVRKVNLDKLRARCIEASEQCERLSVPSISAPVSLMSILSPDRPESLILFADEAGDARSIQAALSQQPNAVALLIGPEGGFTPQERMKLREASTVTAVTLGPRILRADTAVYAGLAVIQSLWGDWT